MQDLCPLCLKNGVKKKIKLLQINLQDAVWVCEEEKCIWPFGYEDFVFCPRVLGKIWSCYWDDCKSTAKLKETVITSTKPALCSASITSVKDISNKCFANSSLAINHSESINNVNNNSNVIESKNYIDDLQTSADKKSNISLHNNDVVLCNININSLNKEATSGLHLNDNNLQLDNNSPKNMKIENEFINSLNKHEFSTQNAQNINSIRGIPKITSIEKTNIDISNVITGNQISLHQDLDKKILSINKSADGTEQELMSLRNGKVFSNHLSECKKVVSSKPLENNQVSNEVAVTKPNLSVTMMEIDGLPPITLSFEIPVTTTIPETVTSSIQQTDCRNNGDIVGNNIKSNTAEVKSMFVRRNVTSGKQYEKFSFSAIKKKMEPNNSININSNSINSLNIKSNPKIQDVQTDATNSTKKENSNENFHDEKLVSDKSDGKEITSVTNIICNDMSNQSNNFVTVSNSPSQENITPSIVNTSVNIDTVLEDLLSSDYSVSEDINDEWINSLLN